jgi:glucose/arabinose dehydrogenase
VVENGASIDNVTGLTATFVNDNPADELNVVNLETGLGKSYGFPDCTTLWNPDADPIGDPQYTLLSKGDQISLHLDPTRNDAWCRGVSNNVPPILSFQVSKLLNYAITFADCFLQAHSVPLDIKFLTPFKPGAGSLPLSFLGDAFVSLHGSFDRKPATGYSIVR